MFLWIERLINGIVNGFGNAASSITDSIWVKMVDWFYTAIYTAVSDFFTLMGGMGADVFALPWVQSLITLFTLFGWALFVAGVIVAIFDVAIESQTGRANIKTTALNILKGFFACSLIGVLPVELYKFCITLQHSFSVDIANWFGDSKGYDIATESFNTFVKSFVPSEMGKNALLDLLIMIAFAYCVIKIFFQNIKRGGILLVQMSVGTLYMFSVPRGYTDGFMQWIKQVIATCLTAFLQTTLLYLGLMTFNSVPLLGLGIMLASNEVPRIAQQFGLDSSARFNLMSVVHATATAVNLTRTISKVGKP